MSRSRTSLTAKTHQYLIKQQKKLTDERNKERTELAELRHDEKDPFGNQPLRDVQDRINVLDGKIDILDELISNAVIVPDSATSNKTHVAIGDRVVLERQVDGVPECF